MLKVRRHRVDNLVDIAVLRQRLQVVRRHSRDRQLAALTAVHLGSGGLGAVAPVLVGWRGPDGSSEAVVRGLGLLSAAIGHVLVALYRLVLGFLKLVGSTNHRPVIDGGLLHAQPLHGLLDAGNVTVDVQARGEVIGHEPAHLVPLAEGRLAVLRRGQLVLLMRGLNIVLEVHRVRIVREMGLGRWVAPMHASRVMTHVYNKINRINILYVIIVYYTSYPECSKVVRSLRCCLSTSSESSCGGHSLSVRNWHEMFIIMSKCLKITVPNKK